MDAKYWGYQALKFWKVLKSHWREIPIQDNERHCGPSVIWPGRDKVVLFSCRCHCFWGTLKHSLFGVISCTSLWRNSWRSISFQVKNQEVYFFFKGWPWIACGGDRPDGEGEAEDSRKTAKILPPETERWRPDETGNHEKRAGLWIYSHAPCKVWIRSVWKSGALS